MKKVNTENSTNQNTLLPTRPHSRNISSVSSSKLRNVHSSSASETEHTFCKNLHEARLSLGLTQKALAERSGLCSQSIARLEQGIGSVENLITVMNKLGIRLVGIGPGKTLSKQLQNRRKRLSLSPMQLSAKTGVSPSMIARLEGGKGKIANLLKVLEILAPKARLKAPKQPSMDPVDKQDTDSRFTPSSFMTAIYAAFGVIDVDPCAHKLSSVQARHRIFFSEGGNGLAENWIGQFVFVNPPFSAIVDWLQYAHKQWRDGHAKTVACLIPIRTDTKFFHDKLRKNADIFFIEGRVSFLMPSGKKQSNFQPLLLVVFGATKQQKARYERLTDGFWLERAASGSKYQLIFADVIASWRGLRSMCSSAMSSLWSWIVSGNRF